MEESQKPAVRHVVIGQTVAGLGTRIALVALAVFILAVGGALTYWDKRLIAIGQAQTLAVKQAQALATKPAQTLAARPASTNQVRTLSDKAITGRNIFLQNCAGCHGQQGDAQTEVADYLDPRPRDFTRGIVKFKSTPFGQPPTHADLVVTVSDGLRWSSMPPFKGRMKSEEIQAVVQYLEEAFLDKAVAKVSEQVGPPDPPQLTPEMATRGGVLFQARCAACHGPGGTPHELIKFQDVWGKSIRPRDLAQPIYKRGSDPRNIYLRIKYGISGTPMTNIASGLKDAEIWSLTAYVRSLQRRPKPIVDRGRLLFAGMGCVQCHGEKGQGNVLNPNYARKSPPSLNNLAEKMFLEDQDDAAFVIELLGDREDLATSEDFKDIPNYRVVLAQYNAIRNVIRKGSHAAKADPSGTEPPLHMPAWSALLDDEKIDAIIAYLLSLQPSDLDDEEVTEQ